MERTKVIRYALDQSIPKINVLDIPFFFNLFNQVFDAGFDEGKGKEVLTDISNHIRVYDSVGNSYLCDNILIVKKKYGYEKRYIEKHLRSGLPTNRGHVFRYEK